MGTFTCSTCGITISGFFISHACPPDRLVAVQKRLRQAEQVIHAADALCGLLGTHENPAELHYAGAMEKLDLLIARYKEN